MKKDAQETAGKEDVQKDLQQSQDQNAEAQTPEKEVKKWNKATNTKRDLSHTHWLLF